MPTPNPQYPTPNTEKKALLFSMGAEAKIYLIENSCKSMKIRTSAEVHQLGVAKNSSNKIILKQRTPKSYRHKDLDNQIRTSRTKHETKILTKAKSIGANVPKIIHTEKFEIHLEFIDGDRLSQTLNFYPEKKQIQIIKQIAKQISLLHKNNIIHADLTTSNIILNSNTKYQIPNTTKSKIYIIDFGLSYISTKTEDKAVDLHLLKQALQAKHYKNHEKLFQEFLETYNNQEVIQRLKIVQKRGRYKK